MRRICVAVLVLLVTACGNPAPGDSATAAPASPPDAAEVTPSPDGADAAPGAGPSPATPKGGTLDPRKIPWTSAEPTADGRTIRVEWSSGVEPCSTLDRVDVAETGTRVVITLYEGPLRASPDAVCVEIAITKVTEVRLDRPLGDREIVDGAR